MQETIEQTYQRLREYIPSEWVKKHQMKTSSGLPFDFEGDRGFMWEFLNDTSPLQVMLKAPQVGATETEIIKSFHVAKMLHKDIIYTLPTQDDVYDMGGGKVNRIIAQNPILMSWVKDHDSIEQKSVGDNIIHYRGTYTQKQAMMVSSQCNIHDEVDASNSDVITQYETRLQGQVGGWRWYFSHPSVAGHGVDVYWQQSDKKEWIITCPCGKRQILSWPDSIDRIRECYQCKYCKQELSDDVRRRGEWKATAVGRFSGYHVSQLMCAWITARAILDAKDDPKKNEQYFYNYVLGLPYVGSENKIPSSVVLKNVVPEVNEQADRIIIGVDTGLPIHYTCMNKQGAFYYGTTLNYDDLEKLLKRWTTSIIIADQGGDLIGIRKLQAQYPGRVFLVFYRKDRKSKEMVDWGENEEQGTVRVDRNQYFQWMVEQLRDVGRIRLNGKVEEWTDWASHFDNVYREIKVALDKPGKDVATNYGAELIWKRNGADHYAHTLLYALVGLDRFGTASASFIKRNDTMKFPMASSQNNTISARRVLGKKIQGYVDQFD